MAPSFTKLRTISKKLGAKINKLMHNLRMNKTAKNKAEAAVEVELFNTVTNAEQGKTTKPMLPVVDQGITNMPEPGVMTKVIDMEQGTSTKPNPTHVHVDLHIAKQPEITVETGNEGINSALNEHKGAKPDFMLGNIGQAAITTPTTNTPEAVVKDETSSIMDMICVPARLLFMCISDASSHHISVIESVKSANGGPNVTEATTTAESQTLLPVTSSGVAQGPSALPQTKTEGQSQGQKAEVSL
ncbi:hypothetical protein DHEL01_v203590 [Diaporthe helianthi]|uniref:Uncharacterized protein n=1 Tax=Diaporthe helianthi TaxID=158607 RepID=A0A2P5I6A8_DIAHE|nr:hypothetical protein DHEL01_v203590 [Diaporthe helianthi]